MRIDREEVLRYLGHRGQKIDAHLGYLIDEAIAECENLAQPRFLYRIFPLDRDSREGSDLPIKLEGASLHLTGHAIGDHLQHAQAAALLAATLGTPLDAVIRRYEHTDLTRSLVLDAAAADLIEKVCDKAEAEINERAAAMGLQGNFRFSPGYGDLPLDIQPQLLRVLDATRRIGLTCTNMGIMLPRKSVTAIIGLSRSAQMSGPANKCDHCNRRNDCPYQRSEGGTACVQ